MRLGCLSLIIFSTLVIFYVIVFNILSLKSSLLFDCNLYFQVSLNLVTVFRIHITTCTDALHFGVVILKNDVRLEYLCDQTV